MASYNFAIVLAYEAARPQGNGVRTGSGEVM